MTTEIAADPLDRKMLEWGAEAIDWGEQRERFGVVMTDVQRAESGAQTTRGADAGSDDQQADRDEPAVALVAVGAVPWGAPWQRGPAASAPCWGEDVASLAYRRYRLHAWRSPTLASRRRR